MRNVKGITLIALIITIIVMLILVAVTIAVALNGGIFDNAREAKTKTQRQAEKEGLISVMVGAYNSSGNFATSNVGELPSGAQWCTEEETSYEHAVSNPTSERNWIITKNGNKFYIDESGSVLDEKPDTEVDDLIPTDAELATVANNDYIFASSNNGNAIQYMYEQEILMIIINGQSYVWCCTDSAATVFSSYSGSTIEPKKWYNYSNFAEYNPQENPLENITFTEIRSESYLSRVYSSFN